MGNFSAFFGNVESSDDEDFCHIEIPQAKHKQSVATILSNHSNRFKDLIEQWTAEQNRLSLIRDEVPLSENVQFTNVKYVAGVDISFPSNKKDLVHACACLVVLEFKNLEIVYRKCTMVHLTSIYVPEYLAFREVKAYTDLFKELKSEKPDLYPDLVLVDGNGMLHTRTFGIASHLGVLLNLPTIGVAKKLFHVDGIENNSEFKKSVASLSNAGSSLELTGNSGFLYGKAVRSTLSSTNPIFISVGYKISLDISVDIVLLCCKKRIPEPVRWADILSREFLRKSYTKHAQLCHDYDTLNEEFLYLSDMCERKEV